MTYLPATRFRSFNSEWKQSTLGELVQEMIGGAPLTPEQILDEGDYIIIPKKAVQAGGELVLDSDCSYVTKDVYDKYVNNQIDKSHTIVVLRDLVPTGPSIGYAVRNNVANEGILAQGVYGIHFKDSILPDFFIQYSNTPQYRKIMQTIMTGSTQVHIRNSTFLTIDLFYPSLDEQRRIVDFLNKIDKLIVLCKEEIDKNKELKKGMLQRMFPKDGERVPEIRFPGFTDDWEQRKLADISSLITKGTTPLDKSGIGSINFVKVENIDASSGIITPETKISEEEHNGYLRRSRLQENDILFSIAGTLGRVSVVKSSILPANTNQALAIIRTKEGDISYLITALRGNVVADFIRRNPTVGAQPNLSLEQVSNLEIPYPSLEEQKRIGEFFNNLDNLITLHQRKLDAMKEYKKGLLQQMFV